MKVKRGEVYYINFRDTKTVGSEQAKDMRPGVIVSNDIANENDGCDVITIALLTSSLGDTTTPNAITHVRVTPEQVPGLNKVSDIMTEQLRSISKQRLGDYLGMLPKHKLEDLDNKLLVALGIFDFL